MRVSLFVGLWLFEAGPYYAVMASLELGAVLLPVSRSRILVMSHHAQFDLRLGEIFQGLFLAESL